MGFSFSSGGGLSVLPNHAHTVVVADGGPLSTTGTLIGTGRLFSLMVALG